MGLRMPCATGLQSEGREQGQRAHKGEQLFLVENELGQRQQG